MTYTDALKRAAKTFVQAVAGVVGANAMGLLDADVAKTAAVAGISAVVALAWNSIQAWASK